MELGHIRMFPWVSCFSRGLETSHHSLHCTCKPTVFRRHRPGNLLEHPMLACTLLMLQARRLSQTCHAAMRSTQSTHAARHHAASACERIVPTWLKVHGAVSFRDSRQGMSGTWQKAVEHVRHAPRAGYEPTRAACASPRRPGPSWCNRVGAPFPDRS